MILKNALFWDGKTYRKSDLFVEDGKFSFSSGGPTLDVGGFFLVPGFVDSHAHLVGTGLSCAMISFSRWEEFFDSKVEGETVLGRGWEEFPPKEILTRLDEIDKPVFLFRKCGHVVLLNKKAMELFGTRERFLKEDLEEVYRFLFRGEIQRFFDIGESEFLKHGVTFVQSDDLHGVDLKTLKETLKRSKIRVFEKLNLKIHEISLECFGTIGDRVYVKGVKVFADGSLGAKTAYISGEYEDGTNGLLLVSKEELEEYAKFCSKNGLLLNVHAIGDEALSVVLDVLTKYPGHRVIHAQLVREEDLERSKNVSFSVQPHFFFEDQKLLKNLRVKALMYPFYEMFKRGLLVAFSSDSPVSPCDPKYVAEHALKMGFSREETFYLLTEAGARQVGVPTGKIAPGFLADFCLYERDPLLFEDDPVAVFVGGELVKTKNGAGGGT